MPEVLSLPRMARLLGVTQRWLRQQADDGLIPSLPAGGRRYLFDAAAVQSALAKLAAQSRQEVADAE